MIARILRILLILQLMLAGGFFLLAERFLHIDNLLLTFVFALSSVLLLRLWITGQNFFLAWRYHSDTPAPHRLRLWQKIRLFFGEFRATLTSSSYTMSSQMFAKRSVEQPVDYPVLLIHGYLCNSGYWKKMSDVLTTERIYHHAIDLEPVLGSIDDFVPLVKQAIETLCRDTGSRQIIILAHSMGGLVARAYLRDHGSKRIAGVITLGTPHFGTGLAKAGPGINSRQMVWMGTAKNGQASAWLQELAAGESATTRALFTSIYSYHDNIVAPQASSVLPGASNIAFAGIGHVELALHPLIQRQTVEEIHRISALQQTNYQKTGT